MHKAVSKLFLIVFTLLILFGISARDGRFLGKDFEKKDEINKSFPLADVRKLFPAASRVGVVSVDEAMVYDASGKQLGSLVHTLPTAAHIIGYASYLPIMIGLDPQNRLAGIVLQANSETPGFINRLEKQKFFNTWDGLPAEQVVTGEFDAVSRATLTTRATIDSLKLRLGKHLTLEQERRRLDYNAIALELLGWVFLIISLSAVVLPRRLAKYRTAILLLAVLIPGFGFGRFVSLELIRTWALNGVPFAAQSFIVLVLMLTFLIPMVTTKSWYCMWYCPYGAAQELAGRLFPRKVNIAGPWLELCRWLRAGFLIAIVFLLLIGVKLDVTQLEPFSAFLYKSATDSVIWLALIFLGLSLIIRKPWCNYVCPSGQLVEVFRTWPQNVSSQQDTKENRKMKIQEVISLLLAIAIVILLMNPAGLPDKRDAGVAANALPQKMESTAIKNQPVKKQTEKMEVAVDKAKIVAENIFQRKSVRNFTGRSAGKEQLEALVKAGMAAPTARNVQPWQFVVVTDKAMLAQLNELLPYAKMTASAGAAIVVCGDLKIATEARTEKLWMQDCSAATQNILLAAEGMGLGAVWTAAYPYEDRIKAVVETIKLPEHVVPLCVIPVGYPTGVDKPKDKWKPERLHWNEFSSQD